MEERKYQKEEGKDDYSEFSPWIKNLRSEIKLGEKYLANKDYSLAHDHFYYASKIAERNGLVKIEKECLVSAGNAKYEEGGWLNYQRAAHCYGSVGERGLLEKMCKELKFKEEDITPGSWMGMARFLANRNSGRYEFGK